jgi:methylamine dehydrogenase light chain
MGIIDRLIEQTTRGIARRSSRRSFLTRIGTLIAGSAAAVPLLPVARGAETARAPTPLDAGIEGAAGDPKACEYWRHCAIDGFACACCGGSPTACPPGTEISRVTWIGTCRHPVDGKDYIVSYNDCCGKSPCGRCLCNRNERDRPMYMTAQSNDINWCQGTQSNIYHCTLAAVIGQAVQD